LIIIKLPTFLSTERKVLERGIIGDKSSENLEIARKFLEDVKIWSFGSY
jgi:hypothetical protein